MNFCTFALDLLQGVVVHGLYWDHYLFFKQHALRPHDKSNSHPQMHSQRDGSSVTMDETAAQVHTMRLWPS